MSPTEDCPVFAYNGTAVTAGEAVRAALFRHELPAVLAEVALRVASENQASQGDLEPEDGAVDAMVEQFRVENDLISAEETEAWLEKRGITPEELQDHFTRVYWRRELDGKIDAGEVGSPDPSPELLGNLAVELFISGAFNALAVGLSRRLSVQGAEKSVDPARAESERTRFLERAGFGTTETARWLESLDRSQEWLDGMLKMEAAYRARCESILTPDRLSKSLSALRLSLTRMELETVEFDSIDAAREGRLCVRDDDVTLEEVARESRFPFKQRDVWAEDLPEDQRQRLLCAGIGEVQDPAFYDGVFHLSRVVRRVEPTLDDPTVRSRVEQKILDTHFSDEGAREITWFIR